MASLLFIGASSLLVLYILARLLFMYIQKIERDVVAEAPKVDVTPEEMNAIAKR